MTKKNLFFTIFVFIAVSTLGMKAGAQTANESDPDPTCGTIRIPPMTFGIPDRKAFNLAMEGQNDTEAEHFKFSGYTQVRLRFRQDGSDGFDIRRSRLSLAGKVTGPFDYKLQGEFGGSSGFKLLDAAISIHLHSSAALTFGQQKIPFSLESTTSSAQLDTINRSQPVEALAARGNDVIGNQNGRDIGATVHGSVELSESISRFDYAFGVFNGAGINTSDNNDNKDLAGRFRALLFPGFAAGASFYTGRRSPAGAPDKTFDRSRWGLELSWKLGMLDLKGEYLQGRDEPFRRNGGYVQLGGAVVKDKLQLVVKFDSFDPNTEAARDRRNIATLGVNWFISGAAKIQVNYEFRSEAGDAVDNNLLIAQFQIRY